MERKPLFQVGDLVRVRMSERVAHVGLIEKCNVVSNRSDYWRVMYDISIEPQDGSTGLIGPVTFAESRLSLLTL